MTAAVKGRSPPALFLRGVLGAVFNAAQMEATRSKQTQR
jgi:hypothetical protein